ncbi:NADPH-dependent FMN reductase [Micromonospora aurantiaca (nom. illeg.)]|uniref:NADPH-dependent FMN reductase n=1 Tax=Micromonospora aurantiaca (nom. illeg.) TaxID=47850 RepID=UPI0001BF3E44|nr:NAD(P)H-dependent oxidoreductase [Micromonospora aurantiaca]ADL47508.1 NADPH-dependent FMN reductase [Micromonospora aurantiaca ATCC 27029]
MPGPPHRSNHPAPQVVLIGGSLCASSRTGRLAVWCAGRCAEEGAVVTCLRGADLELPFYRPHRGDGPQRVPRIVAALARADGVVLLSPTYHGTVSGLLKNALDYANDLADAREPFLSDRPIGCVAISSGEQGAHSTLATLRTIAHALRGWPTPLGLALPGERAELDTTGAPADPRTRAALEILLDQVLVAARRRVRPTVAGARR